ncbi:MAG: 6-aminohexanoate-dimer hydrolase [Chlorobi bacterium OLB7]|nr:MAG: 6-aminohexanoate-dimer hydrolase [Chlorobi bacterium OLB7]
MPIRKCSSCASNTPMVVLLVLLSTLSFVSCQTSNEQYWPDKEWESASPTARGMDSAMLDNLVNAISNEEYGYIKSLLIVKDGYLITERYFHDADTSMLLPLYSVTKSILGMAWGIAEQNGDVPPVDTPIEKVLPQYSALIQSEPLKSRITIHDLLTMTAGIDWVENNLREGEITDDFYNVLMSPDMPSYVLSKTMVDTPGMWFTYNSGCSILLSSIFTTSCGKKFGQYINQHIFNPIGIDSAFCQEVPSLTNMANGLFLTSREMARFGLLIARDGQWNNQEIIPREWVRRATTPSVFFDQSLLLTGYGYQWWLTKQKLSVGICDTITVHSALGWGGQMIAVVPKYDLVVVLTAALSDDELEEKHPVSILWHHILPAIIGKQANGSASPPVMAALRKPGAG